MANMGKMLHGVMIVDSVHITVEDLLAIDIARMHFSELTVILDTDLVYVKDNDLYKNEEYKYTWLKQRYKNDSLLTIHSILVLKQKEFNPMDSKEKLYNFILDNISSPNKCMVNWDGYDKKDFINSNLKGLESFDIQDKINIVKKVSKLGKSNYSLTPASYLNTIKKITVMGMPEITSIMVKALANVFNTSHTESQFHNYLAGNPDFKLYNKFDYKVMCHKQILSEISAVEKANNGLTFIDSNFMLLAVESNILSKNKSITEEIVENIRNNRYDMVISINSGSTEWNRRINYELMNATYQPQDQVKIDSSNIFEGFVTAIRNINKLMGE